MARDSRPASPLQVVVNNAGLIEAGTLQARQGRIVLDGGSGMVLAGGRMSASALALTETAVRYRSEADT